MTAWINFAVLVVSGALMTALYLMSVRPKALEARLGRRAYRISGILRSLTSVLMLVLCVNYALYHWYPLPIDPFPVTLPWPYWVSVALAVLVAIPSGYLELRSTRDARSETLFPDPEHTLYGGIYERIRHPMAIGEVALWWVIALLVHSPFLVVFSLIWIPVWIWWCVAEERDLVRRYGQSYLDYRERTGMFFPKRAGSAGQ